MRHLTGRAVAVAVLAVVASACAPGGAARVTEEAVPPPRAARVPDAVPTTAARLVAPATSRPPAPPTSAVPAAPPVGVVDAALARLSLDQRIGQLFMTYTFGAGATAVDDAHRAANVQRYGVGTPAEVVTRHHLGGVILLDRNPLDPTRPGLSTGALGSPPQIAALTAGLQDAAVADSGVGLLVAADQEGGPVVRVGPPATHFPSAAALGTPHDPALVEAVARATGNELAAMGINQNLAPVADVNVEPDNPVIGARSFGADPTRVAALVSAAVRGYEAAGVLATAKHFPGHGDTLVDSHVGLPVVDHTRDEWQALDLPPFAAAVGAGVPAVMTAHLSFPALDPSGTPATLSPTILRELREGLGFGGVIVTDALGMAGVAEGRSAGDVAVASLLAGADMLLMPADLPAAQAAVRAAVADGTLTAARLDASVRRILAMKERAGLLGPGRPRPDLSVVGSEDHRRLQALADATG